MLQQRLKDLGVLATDFIKESLGLLHTDIEEIKDEAGGEGYNQAVEDYEIRTLAEDSSPQLPDRQDSPDKTIWLLSCKAWTRLD